MYLMSKIFRPVETVLQRTKNVYTSKNHAVSLKATQSTQGSAIVY